MVTMAPPFGGLVVAMVNAVDICPAGTTTCAGSEANARFERLSTTVTPPLGAAAVRVTVPVTGAPPITVVGLSVNAARAGGGAGLTVKVAVFVTPS